MPSSEKSSNWRPSWSRGWRIAASVLIVVHLAAVFVPPFAFATRGPDAASPLAMTLRSLLRPYIEPMFLDHGYAFFAPEPGPSHLLRCRFEFADGRAPLELIFPDRTKQKPRLLYHRHFMLAEQLHALFVPANPPPTPDPAVRAEWREARARYELRRRSFAAHLQHAFGAERVEILRVEHRVLSPEQRARGMKLTDPSLYENLLETFEEEIFEPLEELEELP